MLRMIKSVMFISLFCASSVYADIYGDHLYSYGAALESMNILNDQICAANTGYTTSLQRRNVVNTRISNVLTYLDNNNPITEDYYRDVIATLQTSLANADAQLFFADANIDSAIEFKSQAQISLLDGNYHTTLASMYPYGSAQRNQELTYAIQSYDICVSRCGQGMDKIGLVWFQTIPLEPGFGALRQIADANEYLLLIEDTMDEVEEGLGL